MEILLILQKSKRMKKKVTDIFLYLFLLILFRIFLDLSYQTIIVDLFIYSGFQNNVTGKLIILSWILFFLFAAIGYRWFNNTNTVSGEVLFFILTLSIIPFTSMVRFGNFTTIFIICNSLFYLFLYIFHKIINHNTKYKHSKYKFNQKVEDRVLYCIMVISFVTILYISRKYTGFRINMSLLNVYDLREDAKGFNLPTWLEYLFGWTRAINTILIAYYMRKKRYSLAIVSFFLQVLSFGIDGSKSVLFYAICALGISLLPNYTFKKINQLVLIGLVVLAAGSTILYKMTGNYVIGSLFIRRVMFLPVQLGQNYFDFFTTHIPDFYRRSFMKYFGLKTPYSNMPYMIGEVYYDKPDMPANSGLIADAITNLSYLGIILEPLFIIIVLKILDKSSQGLDIRIYTTTALYVGFMMLNTFLPIILLSHGVIVIIILLTLMGRSEKQIWRINL